MNKHLLFLLMLFSACGVVRAVDTLALRGVVYDVGLMYGGKDLSVRDFDAGRVAYDMSIISKVLGCNAVRIEGESIERLTVASREAHRNGLRVLFNPWKMNADSAANVAYMAEAAVAAENLRAEGLDLVFVAGCEYTLFSKGAFPGDTFDERLQWFMRLGSQSDPMSVLSERCVALNRILRSINAAVRRNFHGEVTYSSGTWESVDWSLFDIVGIDYYRNGESTAAYIEGLERYRRYGKPVVVMEMGCCAYQGAAERGSFGFSVLQGTDDTGNAIYEGGTVPTRDESVQADYIEENIGLLRQGGAYGVFVYVFSYPIYPCDENGIDLDMTSYALVKSFPADDRRTRGIPSWRPKQAFFRLGALYNSMK